MDEILSAIDGGDSERAFGLLRAYLRQHPRDPQAWMAMSDVVDDPQRRIESLERALAYTHDEAQANAIRARLEGLRGPTGVTVAEVDEPVAYSTGEADALANAMDEPVYALDLDGEPIGDDEPTAIELEEDFDTDRYEPLDDERREEEYMVERREGSGSNLWLFLVIIGAALSCVGLFVILNDLTR